MSRRTWRWINWISVSLAAVYLALVGASIIYLAGMERLYLLRFPYLQWIEAARWWHYAPSVLFWLSAGAAGPLLVMGLAGAIVIRHRRQAAKSPLYGTTDFTPPNQLRNAGIGLKRRPF